MAKDITIDHKDISDSQNLTPQMEKEFKKRGLDLHRHEVEKIEDDFKTGKRHLSVKCTKYHAIGNVPWHKI